jgi:hypothetical protein
LAGSESPPDRRQQLTQRPRRGHRCVSGDDDLPVRGPLIDWRAPAGLINTCAKIYSRRQLIIRAWPRSIGHRVRVGLASVAAFTLATTSVQRKVSLFDWKTEYDSSFIGSRVPSIHPSSLRTEFHV